MTSSRLLLAALALLCALLPGRAAAADVRPEDYAVLKDVVAALRADDPDALVELVAFDRRHAERAARGLEAWAWSDLDGLDQLLARKEAVDGWLEDDRNFLGTCRIWAVDGLDDPDAGEGPVPQRAYVQAVLATSRDDRLRDLLLTLDADLDADPRVIGLTLGPPYVDGANPNGSAGLQPVSLDAAQPAEIAWSRSIDSTERDEARELVGLLLKAESRRDEQLFAEYLHRVPHAGVTALLERVGDLQEQPEPDRVAQHLLLQAVATITGRETDFQPVARFGDDPGALQSRNDAEITSWVRWHGKHGESFAPAPIEDPLDPTFTERSGFAESLHLPRWEEAVARAAEEGGASGGAGGASGGSTRGSAGGSAGGTAGGSTGVGTSGSRGVGSASGVGGSSGVGSASGVGVGSASGGSARGVGGSGVGSSRGVGGSAAPDGAAEADTPERPRVVLREPVRGTDAAGRNPRTDQLEVLWGESEVTVEELGATLPEPVREVLDEWIDDIVALDLRVVLTGHDEHVVMGLFGEDDQDDVDATLREAGTILDDAWDELDPILPVTRGHGTKPVVALLFDERASRGQRFDDLADALARRNVIAEQAAVAMRSQARGLTARKEPMFLQPTWDMAGNAAAGDDEFRLRNEVAHKFAQCMATQRCGQLPTGLLWGLGHLVENRLFESVYQFNRSGFVATGDHFDWPKQARKLLDKKGRKRGFDLVERLVAADDPAGSRDYSGLDNALIVYATLEAMAHHEPLALLTLFEDLADLQREKDPFGFAPTYIGDAETTRLALETRLAELEIDHITSRLSSIQ